MLKEMLRSTINLHFSYVILCFSKIFGELFGIQDANRLFKYFKLKNSVSHTKGQLISKAIYGVLDSPKKQTKKFDLIYHSSKSTEKETGKTHLCAVLGPNLYVVICTIIEIAYLRTDL